MMIQIGSGGHRIQIILNDPPLDLYNKWANDRIEYYKRVEPNAPFRDVAPEMTETAAYRIRLTGAASVAVWSVILSNPEQAGLANIKNMSERHELRKINFVPAGSSS